MYCNRIFRLLAAKSLCKIIPSGSCQSYKNSHSLIHCYNQHVKNGNSFKTFRKFLSFYVFQTSSNCRFIYVSKRSFDRRNYTGLISLSGLLSFFYGKEEDKESDLVTIIKRGILSIQREDYKTAEKILHVALRVAQEQHNADGVTYIYDLLANVAFELQQWEKAETLFLNVMQRELANGIPQDDMKIVHMSLKLAKIYESLNDDEKAEQGFQFCLNNLQQRVDKSNKDDDDYGDVLTLWAMTLDWYARFLQEKNRMDEALDYYKKAYNMCIQLNGEIHEQNVILLNDIGTITYLRGDGEGALELLNKAIEIGKHLPNMEELSSVYVNLGTIYLQKGMYTEAEKSCTEGFQNATRHRNPEGVNEANICLEEVKKLFKK